MREQMLKYMKQDKLPHVFCPGCGNGTVMHAMFKAIDELQLDTTQILIVGGIGCSSRIATYTIFDSLHTLHGRALPFAIGAKLANPSLKVIVITGDGDASSIGGNHLIHAARRNMSLSVFIVNNYTYGMTGGQYSPTTPIGSFTATSPCGHVEQPFSITDLLVGAGAPFVARTGTFYFNEMVSLMKKALVNDSFSAIDIFTQCPTNYGRSNRLGNPFDLMKSQSDILVPKGKFEQMTEEEREGKFARGLIRDAKIPTFMDHYKACVLLTRRGVRR
ncbi:MAG TPA: thiamine pyrophosphate-dependent enzyme [Caldisericia bacterium]|nr:thiamine pyrophosphate-dependent enzyme [Caldisericia bacterium]HPF49144.1 thiamine pyrophosphate-dependent enzyme [Caldisericia bacterium]HPI82992.1 thiamine pyrophosphate-dependent enzyme [Caldisericia bacterium]HPQ92219.1 thiamine pyrophosphate-dependent enzyme [Caldisericia bacterium]HRV74683.1 thiamine pyrophosphate-dependent enzyme [Caldisericia bacterium]